MLLAAYGLKVYRLHWHIATFSRINLQYLFESSRVTTTIPLEPLIMYYIQNCIGSWKMECGAMCERNVHCAYCRFDSLLFKSESPTYLYEVRKKKVSRLQVVYYPPPL